MVGTIISLTKISVNGFEHLIDKFQGDNTVKVLHTIFSVISSNIKVKKFSFHQCKLNMAIYSSRPIIVRFCVGHILGSLPLSCCHST